ncbi:MFS transporter [Thermodesulfobacteriota bacterium]
MRYKNFAWSILASGFVINLIFAGTHFTFGVFLKPIADNFGWTRGATAFAFTLSWWISSPASVLLGWFSDRIGARKVLVFGAIIFSLGIFLSGTIQNLWQFYIYLGVLTGLGRAASRAPLLSAVIPYLGEHKGLAMGILLSGTSIGTMILPPLVRYMISTVGWQVAYYMLAVIAVVIILPAVYFLKGPRPQEGKAHQRVTESHPDGQQGGILPQPAEAWNAHNILKTPFFWIIVVTGFFCCASHSLPVAHIVAFATDQGIEKLKAASLLGMIGFTSAMGRLCWGVISDRIGARRTLLTCIFLQTIMLFWLASAESLFSFYILSSFFGFSSGGVLPLYPIIVRELFGLQRFGTIYGVQSVGTSVGMGTGAIIGGFIFDAFGRYSPAFIFSGVIGTLAIVGAAFLAINIPTNSKDHKFRDSL